MTIKFSLPASAQYFTPFPRLPIELRLQIWEDAIYQPGMNFLRISYNSTIPRRLRNNVPFPPIRKATLQPMYHHPEAEDSQFYNLNNVLENLSLACAESNRVVRRFKQHPDTIKLPDGRVVTALDSHDTICLDEYVPQNLFTSGCRILTDVDCFGLDRIRHVAIRYCYNWESKGPHCFECFRRHSVDTKKALPLHVYQFLVRHMPNLQTVYLIDFLILRRDTNDPAVAHKPPTFTSRDRKFYEVDSPDQNEWQVSSQVFEVLDWVKQNYLRYSAQSTTTRCRHKEPERVQFKVLSCEWEMSPRVSPEIRKRGGKRT
ncbi:hypothetical protein B0T11DRAFT_302647 [Plectosphaerella cucumerina]|uniref:2EXR domain-containing protein n=1 Tax=Plectosphaerella cucumerina TaxID=40658 RepID=A0A8K0WZ06_9PEZI|nr:hypothetical protein B0T11DRAFT_302647 [Plectosphaerella cucumerina]